MKKERKMRWQEQALINNKFSALFSVGDTFKVGEIKYEITAEGNTHILCVNKNSVSGTDLFISKEKFIKDYGHKSATK